MKDGKTAKIAVITGAAQGIGRRAAKVFGEAASPSLYRVEDTCIFDLSLTKAASGGHNEKASLYGLKRQRKQTAVRMWRNWQTRRSQKPVG